MKAFHFDRYRIDAYRRFSLSFSSIRSADLPGAITTQYEAGMPRTLERRRFAPPTAR